MGRSPPVQVVPQLAPDAGPPDFNAVFEREFSYIWRALARLGVPEADREDLANEVFFQVHRRWHTADFERPIRPWLFAFAFRIASSHRRLARNRRERPGDLPDTADVALRADESMEQREARDLVDRGLDALDMEQRAVFVLHEIDGFAIPEIATSLGVPLNTAYSRLRLARSKFATAVRRIKLAQGES